MENFDQENKEEAPELAKAETINENEDEADILADLIHQKEQLEISMQHIQDVENNLAIFTTCMRAILKEPSKLNLYDAFSQNFDMGYRSSLFENVCEFFKNEEFITDEILFYWKLLIVCLLKSSRRYKTRIDDLVLDMENQSTNLRLVREKYTIRCFINDEHICYFKDNGDAYYVS